MDAKASILITLVSNSCLVQSSSFNSGLVSGTCLGPPGAPGSPFRRGCAHNSLDTQLYSVASCNRQCATTSLTEGHILLPYFIWGLYYDPDLTAPTVIALRLAF